MTNSKSKKNRVIVYLQLVKNCSLSSIIKSHYDYFVFCIHRKKKDKNKLAETAIITILVNHFFLLKKVTFFLSEYIVMAFREKNPQSFIFSYDYSLKTSQYWKSS